MTASRFVRSVRDRIERRGILFSPGYKIVIAQTILYAPTLQYTFPATFESCVNILHNQMNWQ
jgi:hypothetical protein